VLVLPPFGFYDPASTLPDGSTAGGEEPVRQTSLLEIDPTCAQLFEGRSQKLHESGRFTNRGERRIPELDREALVVSDNQWEAEGAPRIVSAPSNCFDMQIYLDPVDYAYLGISNSVYHDGKKESTDSVFYRKLEYTDVAPSMDVGGMREISTVPPG